MVPLDEFATEIESQSRPTDPVGFGIACTRKLTEDARLVLFGDAYSTVTDAHAGLLCVTCFIDSHLDWPTFWTVPDGIAEQVGEHLLDAHRVRVHHQGGQRGHDRKRMTAGRHTQTLHRSLHQRHQICRFAVQLYPSALQARHIEQVFGQFYQLRRGLSNALERFLLPVEEFGPPATFV